MSMNVCATAVTVEDWDRSFDTNVKGTFFCYKYASKQMITQGRGGRIIGASSGLGKRAQELGPHKITVNTYAPGPIDTQMLTDTAVAMAEKRGFPQEAFLKKMHAQSPLGYIGAPEDIASAVSYLASKESHFITGQSVSRWRWGNGSGRAREKPVEAGTIALAEGFRHIDTAQGYNNEPETNETLQKGGVSRGEIWLTSKLSQENGAADKEPIPKEKIRESVESTIKRLGSTPDLFLIHNPFVPSPGQLVEAWQIFEQLKDEGILKSIGVSNFRPQDLEAILAVAKHKPVVNQIEYHPYVLTHLAPVLAIQEKHGIVTEAYGPLTPVVRHPTGGPLKSILTRISKRISSITGKPIDEAAVLLLWTHANGVVAVTASGSPEHIKELAEVGRIATEKGDLLTKEEVEEITETGKTIHFRGYPEHMSVDFPPPDLPDR
ncbi:hypothetical protein HWV62_1066 [Athelia sp. TMB]|nr:hypothetical protein HWV62_1066 [Athelia sp. TMB]